MSTGLLQTSSARPLRLRMRPDLACVRARYQGMRYWLVKDPVGLRYFRFQDEEFALLQFLDGRRSLDEIKDAFEASFKPQKITVEELQRFVGHLHSSGLVLSHNPGQGEKLLERARKRTRQQRLAYLANILFLKLPGIDPERILRRLYPKVRWIFTPAGVWGALLLMLSAITLVAINWDEFRGRPELQSFSAFFNVYNVVWLWIALGIAKIIHEFGHGLTCTHFGGECHEMGVLFLVLTPCLYCNVSDSWMMPNKWHRIWISSAGIYVEVVLASLATFVWWNTEPGMVHNLAFSTMFVCSVSTILFNANPLLRYDGYYIMMDLLEIPNLRTKSTNLVQRFFAKWCLGVETPEDPFMPQSRQWAFIAYAIASYLYRWLVTFGILWFLYHFLGTLPEPWNKLRSLSWILAAGAVTTLVVVPTYRLGKFLFSPGRTVEVKKVRIAITGTAVAAVLAVVLLIPFPLRVRCPVHIEPQQGTDVKVTSPGVVEDVAVAPGDTVHAGETLVTLSNPDLELEMADLKLRKEHQRLIVEGYEAQRQIAEAESARDVLESLEKQIEEKQRQLDKLHVVAPHDGVVIPPPYKPPPDPLQRPRMLTGWYGTPLEPRNHGVYLDSGAWVCTVAPPGKAKAELVIDQGDIEYVRKRQKGKPTKVRLKLDELQEETLEGEIAELAKVEVLVAPPELTNKAGGEVPTEPGPGGMERPAGAFYYAAVLLDDPDGLLRPGFRGRAKIEAGKRTYGQWLWRWISDTYRFRL